MIGQIYGDIFLKLTDCQLAMEKHNNYCLWPIRFGKLSVIQMALFGCTGGEVLQANTLFIPAQLVTVRMAINSLLFPWLVRTLQRTYFVCMWWVI